MTQPGVEKESAARAGDGIIAHRDAVPDPSAAVCPMTACPSIATARCRRLARFGVGTVVALACAGRAYAGDATVQSCLASPVPATGAVVAIGGALRYDNAPVWSRLVALAGGPGARFVVLATASENPERSAALAVAALEAHGAKAEPLPVAPRLENVDLAQATRDPQLIARVAAARGVFFTGGAQERIVDTLQPGGRATPLLEAIHDVLVRGGVIAGTSAGAAVLSRVMFRDATDVLAVMKGALRDGHEVDCGLGLAGPDLFVDQHFLSRGRLGRMLPLMQSRGLRAGLGVEEDSAAILRGGQVEVVGAGGALFVDLAGATTDAQLGAFNIAGVRLTFLGDGDRLDLRTRALSPAAVRARGTRVEPRRRGLRAVRSRRRPFLMDVLADGAVLRGMTYALDGPSRRGPRPGVRRPPRGRRPPQSRLRIPLQPRARHLGLVQLRPRWRGLHDRERAAGRRAGEGRRTPVSGVVAMIEQRHVAAVVLAGHDPRAGQPALRTGRSRPQGADPGVAARRRSARVAGGPSPAAAARRTRGPRRVARRDRAAAVRQPGRAVAVGAAVARRALRPGEWRELQPSLRGRRGAGRRNPGAAARARCERGHRAMRARRCDRLVPSCRP